MLYVGFFQLLKKCFSYDSEIGKPMATPLSGCYIRP